MTESKTSEENKCREEMEEIEWKLSGISTTVCPIFGATFFSMYMDEEIKKMFSHKWKKKSMAPLFVLKNVGKLWQLGIRKMQENGCTCNVTTSKIFQECFWYITWRTSWKSFIETEFCSIDWILLPSLRLTKKWITFKN